MKGNVSTSLIFAIIILLIAILGAFALLGIAPDNNQIKNTTSCGALAGLQPGEHGPSQTVCLETCGNGYRLVSPIGCEGGKKCCQLIVQDYPRISYLRKDITGIRTTIINGEELPIKENTEYIFIIEGVEKQKDTVACEVKWVTKEGEDGAWIPLTASTCFGSTLGFVAAQTTFNDCTEKQTQVPVRIGACEENIEYALSMRALDVDGIPVGNLLAPVKII